MNKLGWNLLVITVLLVFSSQAQQIVSGTIVDAGTKEPIYGVRIDINGQGKAKTDYDGNYSLKLTSGTYTFKASNDLDGYKEQEFEITVIKGEDLRVDFEMTTSITELIQVEVVHYKTDGPSQSDAEAQKKREEAEGTTEELSKEAISRTSPPTAVEAVQMIPGASVQDGRDVYMRGLGDRYTKTILNGMEIPGLDPDRNTVQLDIFPAVLIDNISVYKSATPNLTADFTGGLINIQTIDLPSSETVYFSGSLGFNNRATFNDQFFMYNGGKFDFLGFDDGSRKLPISSTKPIPNPAVSSDYTYQATNAFNKTMATSEAFAFMNQAYSAAYGNQKVIKMKKDTTQTWRYGYNAVVNYRNTNTLFENVQFNVFVKESDSTQNELFRDKTSIGHMAQNNVLWTGLFSQGFKFKKSKYSATLFHTQNGTKSAAQLRDVNFDSNQAVLLKEGLQFTQRSVSNLNISGTHILDTVGQWKLKWNLAPTYSRIADPDIRSTVVEESDVPGPNGEQVYLWNEAVGTEVRRIFRTLNEVNVSGRLDFEYEYSGGKDSTKSSIAFGGLNTYKHRTFDVNEYIFSLYSMSNTVPNDPNWFFENSNLWTPSKGSGVYAIGQQEKANLYDATQNITSAYAMHTWSVDSSFQVTYGARFEHNTNWYTGESSNGQVRYINQKVADTFNILPSVNMVYKIKQAAKDTARFEKTTNFRAAYTQTVARPSFREISISQIYDPIQGRRYLGNIDLLPTLIHNADVRWETFFGRTELISLSAFYKHFINPIEIAANIAAPNEFKPVNAGSADVYGAEFEIKKMIGFRSESNRHNHLMVGANMAYIISRIDMREVKTTIGGQEFTEKELREKSARAGEVIGNYRPMYGQAPYVINSFVNYQNDSLGLMVNVSYNVQGKKLSVIGIGINPDVYEQPFHSLNLKVTKYIGKPMMNVKSGNMEAKPRWQVGLQGMNLLNNARRRFYESYQAESQVFDYFHPGITITGSVSYTIR